METAAAIRLDYHHASHVSRLARLLPDVGQYLPRYSVSEPRPPLPLDAHQDAMNHARLHPVQLAKYNDLRPAAKKRFDNARAEIRRQHPGKHINNCFLIVLLGIVKLICVLSF